MTTAWPIARRLDAFKLHERVALSARFPKPGQQAATVVVDFRPDRGPAMHLVLPCRALGLWNRDPPAAGRR